MRSRNVSLLVATLFLVVGCEPRGETKTLDQVLAIAQERYAAVKLVEVPGTVQPVLAEAITGLDKLLKANDAGSVAAGAAAQAQLLGTLVSQAGYTSRASLGELMNQYQQIADDMKAVSGELSAEAKSRVKLIVARTYSLLAAELETVRFAV